MNKQFLKLECLLLCLASFTFASSTVPGKLSSDWVGNTFGFVEMIDSTGAKDNALNRMWVQNYIDNIWVSQEGSVYAESYWDEGGRVTGIYGHGKVLGQLANGKTLFTNNGDVVGDSKYVYVTSKVDWGNWEQHGFGVWRFDHAGNYAGWAAGRGLSSSFFVLRDSGESPAQARLAIDTNAHELYLLDTAKGGSVVVFDLQTFAQTPKAIWNITNVDAMVSDHAGSLWVIRNKQVQKVSNRGVVESSVITTLKEPTRLAIDNKGRLLVFDDSTLQVHIFKLTETPTETATLGVAGGIYSGTKGQVLPNKLLPKCAGLGTDSAGNIYIAWGGVAPVAGSDIRSYTPTGSLNWQVYGHSFVACGGFDPATDGKNIYFRDHHYTIDYTQSVGKKAHYESFLWDRANDTPSVFGGSVIVRHLGGETILASTSSDQFAGGFRFYRMNQQVATPAGGLFDGTWAWWIEPNGDVWNCDGSNPIKRYKFLGLDSKGNPLYNSAKPDTFTHPSDFGSVQRIHYDSTSDALYLSGYDAANPAPSGEWGRAGTVFARYDGWLRGTRTLAWKIVLPLDNGGTSTLKDVWVEGDYAFFVTCNSTPSTIVYVFSLKDGSQTGQIWPGAEIAGDIDFTGSMGGMGWVDMAFGIQVFKRSNGEYQILVEDDVHAKNAWYHWCPSGSCPELSTGVIANESSQKFAQPSVRFNLDAGRLEFNGRYDLQGRALR